MKRGGTRTDTRHGSATQGWQISIGLTARSPHPRSWIGNRALVASRNIRPNLWFAFGYNALGIPLAAGALDPSFGVLVSPMLTAAMSLSSVSVIANAMRLRHAKSENQSKRRRLSVTTLRDSSRVRQARRESPDVGLTRRRPEPRRQPDTQIVRSSSAKLRTRSRNLG